MRKIDMISSTGSGSFALLSIYGNLVLVCRVAAVRYGAHQFFTHLADVTNRIQFRIESAFICLSARSDSRCFVLGFIAQVREG